MDASSLPLNSCNITDHVPDYFSISNTPQNDAPPSMSDGTSTTNSLHHKTTVWETFVHLTKGYVGVGVLSLPWAVSQLGVVFGTIACFVMAYWTSCNCWTVVRIKRFLEEQQQQETLGENDENEDRASDVTSVTYPDVGQWAYGQTFHSYVTACICVQQLAVCTVFLSFIGENLLAVLEFMGVSTSHIIVITLTLPAVILLSFLPNLKMLAPVMTAASILVMSGFGVIGIVVVEEWENRPESTPPLNLPQVPLAICAILYSYEGICLILPIETAMKEPQHFGKVFWSSMTLVACIFASFACVCVYAFGNVTNGSITAFLLQTYGENESITWWIMVANAAVSLSILFTYPLQMFPALELVGPWLHVVCTRGKSNEEEEDETDLSGFEPLPPLFEHQATTDFEAMEGQAQEHDYNASNHARQPDDDSSDTASTFTRMTRFSLFPTFTMQGDSPLVRISLVLLTYIVAVAIPNVQSLISLAGALAGSSIALLIPPILELAYLGYLEKQETTTKPISTIPRQAWMYERVKCYALLAGGMVFAVIGTAASIHDIMRIYRGN